MDVLYKIIYNKVTAFLFTFVAKKIPDINNIRGGLFWLLVSEALLVHNCFMCL